jgi:hypothetical protein
VADEQVQPAPETPSAATLPPSGPEDSGSLADHEAEFRRGESRTDAVVSDDAPATASGDAATEERDEKGRFRPRQKAKSQRATPDDVPRIANLTARLRAVEAERDVLKGQRVAPAAAAAPALESPRVMSPAVAPSTPKPTPDQFTDYGDFIEALTDWKTDQKFAAADAKRQEQERDAAVRAEQTRLATSWTQRVTAAKAKYQDFEDVALLAPTDIPKGSLVDAWILEHKAGADVLYHLQKHPNDLHDLLAQPLFEQVDALSLLAQRLSPSSRVPDAATGSSATLAPKPVPRPPNPVRTGPVQTGDEPPDDETSSLADHARYYQQRRRR